MQAICGPGHCQLTVTPPWCNRFCVGWFWTDASLAMQSQWIATEVRSPPKVALGVQNIWGFHAGFRECSATLVLSSPQRKGLKLPTSPLCSAGKADAMNAYACEVTQLPNQWSSAEIKRSQQKKVIFLSIYREPIPTRPGSQKHSQHLTTRCHPHSVLLKNLSVL